MFGIGGRSFTHQVASRVGLDFDTAELVKIQYSGLLSNDLHALKTLTVSDAERMNEVQNILNVPDRMKKVEKAIADNTEVWVSGVGLALSDFSLLEALPNKILLCGGGAGLSTLQEALATSDWYEDLPFARRPVIHLLDDVDIPDIQNATEIDLDYSYITAFGLLRVTVDTLNSEEEDTGLRAKLAKLLQN